jgi:SAM-dependent methyltransferase
MVNMNQRASSKLSCPLCHHRDLNLVEEISGVELASAWLKSYDLQLPSGLKDMAYLRCNRCNLGFFDPAQAGDSALYEHMQQYDWYYVDDKPEYAMAARWLPAAGEVLEVGSGKAAFARAVGLERYRGLEFNQVAIARAAEAGIRLERETIEHHAAQRPQAYSAVASFQVLEHVPNPAGFVTACVHALKPSEGRLLLAVPDHQGLCGLAQNNILDLPPHHVSHWTESTLRELAVIHDLEVLAIEREPVSELHLPWARRALVERRWRDRMGMGERLFDARLSARLTAKFALWQSARSREPVNLISGHTIMGVFRKR